MGNVNSQRPLRKNFARAQRHPVAYGGFDDPVTTSYDIQTDDNQSNDPCQSYYQRRSLMDRTGVNTR